MKGFALPGAPLVVVGHNDRIAWGFTNNGADVLDLYIETFNPANPDEYRVNGAWKKADVSDEVIKVKGAPGRTSETGGDTARARGAAGRRQELRDALDGVGARSVVQLL